jgi:hypothetical protein
LESQIRTENTGTGMASALIAGHVRAAASNAACPLAGLYAIAQTPAIAHQVAFLTARKR